MAPAVERSAERAHFKLYGVLYHHGEPEGSGHYTFDGLHPNGDIGSKGTWLHINEEGVSTVRHEDVFGDDERVEDRCAYMLFYCCTAPAWTR